MMAPIRIMDIRGTHKGGGGPDKTVLLSALNHDKERVFVLVTYLRDPKDKEFQITDRAGKMEIPFFKEVYDRRLLDLKCLLDLHRLIRRYKIQIFHAHDDKTLLYGWLLKKCNLRLIIIVNVFAIIKRLKLRSLVMSITRGIKLLCGNVP